MLHLPQRVSVPCKRLDKPASARWGCTANRTAGSCCPRQLPARPPPAHSLDLPACAFVGCLHVPQLGTQVCSCAGMLPPPVARSAGVPPGTTVAPSNPFLPARPAALQDDTNDPALNHTTAPFYLVDPPFEGISWQTGALVSKPVADRLEGLGGQLLETAEALVPEGGCLWVAGPHPGRGRHAPGGVGELHALAAALRRVARACSSGTRAPAGACMGSAVRRADERGFCWGLSVSAGALVPSRLEGGSTCSCTAAHFLHSL